MLRVRPAAVAMAVILLTLIINSATTLSYYGYPAPRHSKYVRTAAETPVISVNILIRWLESVGLSNYSEVISESPVNTSLRIMRLILNGSTYTLLIGSYQLRSLESLITGEPLINSTTLAKLVAASIKYVYSLGLSNAPKVMINGLRGSRLSTIALNYISLALLRTASSGGNESRLSAELVRLLAIYEEGLILRNYRVALEVAREVARNYSLVAAIYMFTAIPKTLWNASEELLRVNSSKELRGERPLTTHHQLIANLSIKEVIKAALVIRRLGPEAFVIVEKVPLPLLLRAASNVSLNILRRANVSELVSMIRRAVKVSGGAGSAAMPVNPTPEGTGGSPPKLARAGGVRPLPKGFRHYRALIPSAFNPVIKSWVNPSSPLPIHVSRVKLSINLTLIEEEVKPVATVIGSLHLSLPKIATASESTELRMAEAGGGGSKELLLITAAAAASTASIAALALILRSGREVRGRYGGGVISYRGAGEPPPVIKEFWEAVNHLARRYRVAVNPSMTHREICDAVLGKIGNELRLKSAMRRLTRAYEGVRFAGARINESLISRVRELLKEVLRY